MAKGSSRRTFSTSSLHDLCSSKVLEEFDYYSPEMLSLIPPVQRKKLLLRCPIVSICPLEQTCAFDGIDSDMFWDEVLINHRSRLGSYRNYDINAYQALRVPHSSNREKYFTFLTAMIFSGDRFSGHYAMFTSETGTERDYYENCTPPPEERSCPDDIVNYLVAYRKPGVVKVIMKQSDDSESDDSEFYYPLPARDVFGQKYSKLYKEATKGQCIHSCYSHYILKEKHYRLSDEDAVSLMMNECHYYPKKLFLLEYERMHWMWSHDSLIPLLTQFFSKLESLSLHFRSSKDIDGYLPEVGDVKELELVLNCCFSSPVLNSLVILDPVEDDTASLALSSTLATKPCPSLNMLDICCCVRYGGTACLLEPLANIITSHSQLAEIHLCITTGVNVADSSFSYLYTSLIGFVQKQEFSKLTLHGLVPVFSQLPLLLDAFLKTPCSQPQQIHLHLVQPACNEATPIPSPCSQSQQIHLDLVQPACNKATPIPLPASDNKIPSGALEYKSLFIDERSKVTVDFCEWLLSHQPLVLNAFHFHASFVTFGEYNRLECIPFDSVTAFPVHLLSDNALFQTRELSLPIFNDFLNQDLQNLLHHQQLTKLSLRPTEELNTIHLQVEEPKPCNINAITRILLLQKEQLTELMISREYFNYASIESSADMQRFGDALFSLRNYEIFSLCISITWKKEDTSYIDTLYKSWLKHGCKKLKSFQMGNFEYGFALTDELARKLDKMGLEILTY